METLRYGVSYFLLTAYIRFPLRSPTEYTNQPKPLVIITNIHVKRTARRVKGNAGKYAEGGNIIIRIDGRSTVLIFLWSQYSMSLPVPCTGKNVNSLLLPPPPPLWIVSNCLSIAPESSSPCQVTLFWDTENAIICSHLFNVSLRVLTLLLGSSKHIRCSLL